VIRPEVLSYYRPMAAKFLADVARADLRLTQAEHVARAAELPAVIAALAGERRALAVEQMERMAGWE